MALHELIEIVIRRLWAPDVQEVIRGMFRQGWTRAQGVRALQQCQGFGGVPDEEILFHLQFVLCPDPGRCRTLA